MIHLLSTFLKEYRKTNGPLLLAFSGGPDSLSLFHLLLEYNKNVPLSFALAHVDHGWREESRQESAAIEGMAKKWGVPLHIKRLDPRQMAGNLEAACREERLHFFASLCREHGYEAVLMGHHADDLAETVLKRLFEGATLPYLSSLNPEMAIHGMKVWRPLLAVSKKDILKWLEARDLKGFDDRTNLDTKFLRAKCRVQILPFLSDSFGKEVASGLCHIAKEARELREHLDERIAPYLEKMIVDEEGVRLNLSQECPGSLFELKYLIKQFCKQHHFALSRECLEKAAAFIRQKAVRKFFNAANRQMIVDKGILSIRPVTAL